MKRFIAMTLLCSCLFGTHVAWAAQEDGNVFHVQGCVYNADTREWVCPSPGRGSLQAPGDGPGAAADSGSSAGSAGSGAAGSCK